MSIKKFWQEYRFVIVAFLIRRVVSFVWGLFSINFLTFKASFPYIDEMLIASRYPQWLWQWGNFDGVHYLYIAGSGYRFEAHVFFPLYPLLIHLLTVLTSNILLSALILSNTCFFVASLVFFRFVKVNYNRAIAKWAIIFLFVFPTAFFFSSVYSESLFFLLLILSFSNLGLWSLVAGLLAGLTRLVGVFLFPALLTAPKAKLVGVFALFGSLSYFLYTWVVYKNPFLIISDQVLFQNNRASSIFALVTPFQVIWRYIKIYATGGLGHYDTWLAALEFVTFLGVLTILLFLWIKTKTNRSWLVFSLFALLVPSFSGTFSSMPRYVLVCFPIYIFFAQIKHLKIKITLALLFVVLKMILLALFLRGYFVA